jgi:hypothetical protein
MVLDSTSEHGPCYALTLVLTSDCQVAYLGGRHTRPLSHSEHASRGPGLLATTHQVCGVLAGELAIAHSELLATCLVQTLTFHGLPLIPE